MKLEMIKKSPVSLLAGFFLINIEMFGYNCLVEEY